MQKSKQHIVVIGGGTGTHTVLRGLKAYAEEIAITAVISMADSGGSTGRLRDEFGKLPVGDVRMALTALARDYSDHEELLRELFLYRFAKGEGLSGHNFGNLLLVALTDILGSEAAAVAAAAKVLRIQGRVVPVTADNVHLVAAYEDGVTVVGEHAIDEPAADRFDKRIVKLTTDTPGTISAAAKLAIEAADVIVVGPGDLYASLLANFAIEGVSGAVSTSRAKLVYVAHLMERPGQTVGMTLGNCCREFARYVGRSADVLLVNNAPLPETVVTHYLETEGVRPAVLGDIPKEVAVIRGDFVSRRTSEQVAHDVVQRSLIRHDSKVLAAAIMKLLQ